MIQFEDKSKTKKILIATEGVSNEVKIPSISLEEFLDTARKIKKANAEFSTVIIDSFDVIKEVDRE